MCNKSFTLAASESCAASGAVNQSESVPASTSIRPWKSLAEFEQCVELQKVIGVYSDLEIVPARMFIVATKTGVHEPHAD